MFGLFLVKINQPFSVTPDVFAALDDGVFGLSPNKFGFKHHCFFFVSEEDLFFFIHFGVVKEEEFGLIMVEEGPGKGAFSEISYEHGFLL